MNILVTNDDGYNTFGLKLLVKHALKYGNVYVVAPKEEQSGKSHSLTLRKHYAVEKCEDVMPGVPTWKVDSTPADCVRIAHYYLKLDFDIVFSGINAGFNIGDDIIYSGTTAAATEAILCGKKAIAFSTNHNTFEGAINKIEEVLEYIFKNKLLDCWNLYNVNIPQGATKIVYAPQGGLHYDPKYELADDNLVDPKAIVLWTRLDNKGSDIDMIFKKYIVITPLLTDRTNYMILEKLNNQ